MMKSKEIISIGSIDLSRLTIEAASGSPIVTANKIYMPEKKIILIDQMTEHESELFMGAINTKGGTII